MGDNKVNYDIFIEMLGVIHGPRDMSRDIDSLTDDYPEEIVSAIKSIGEKYGANDEDGWLNNHWNRTKNYNEEFAYFIKWKKLEAMSFIYIYISRVTSLDARQLFLYNILDVGKVF